MYCFFSCKKLFPYIETILFLQLQRSVLFFWYVYGYDFTSWKRTISTNLELKATKDDSELTYYKKMQTMNSLRDWYIYGFETKHLQFFISQTFFLWKGNSNEWYRGFYKIQNACHINIKKSLISQFLLVIPKFMKHMFLLLIVIHLSIFYLVLTNFMDYKIHIDITKIWYIKPSRLRWWYNFVVWKILLNIFIEHQIFSLCICLFLET